MVAKAVVDLVPWDPESQEHVDRMFEQRVVCGWKSSFVENWRELQRKGKMNLQWVVLRDEEPDTEVRIANHIAKYPKQSSPLIDTCNLFGSTDRLPASPPRSFIPVGHLSLDTFSEYFPKNVDPSNGVYSITSLYVSDAMQPGGIGNAAMDAIETLAQGSPLYAKVLTLDCVSKEHKADKKLYNAMGTDPPKIAVQEWYERRGYEVSERFENAYGHVDPILRIFTINAVLMRKRLIDEE